jgi:hypothetical protein
MIVVRNLQKQPNQKHKFAFVHYGQAVSPPSHPATQPLPRPLTATSLAAPSLTPFLPFLENMDIEVEMSLLCIRFQYYLSLGIRIYRTHFWCYLNKSEFVNHSVHFDIC